MRNRIPCQRDAGTRLATALRRRPFSACNKGNRRRLHAGNIFAGDYIFRVDPLVQANDAGNLVSRALPYSAAWRERDGGRVGEDPDNQLDDAGCYTYHFLPL